MRIKSLHVPFSFYPDGVGGTEVYVAALAAALTRRGQPAVVAAPGKINAAYLHDGLPVRRFATSADTDVADLYGGADAEAADAFAGILDRERPDVVHLHAFSRACSTRLVSEAHTRGMPVVFTYHAPTVSCARGTLLEWGTATCDGRLDVTRCAGCALHGLGTPRWLAQALARSPSIAGDIGGALGGTIGTALRFPRLIAAQQRSIRRLFSEVDRFVALRSWIADLLAANGVPPDRIVRSEHALCHATLAPVRTARKPGPLRVAFLGRIDRTKGVDVVVRAVRALPESVRLELNVIGAAYDAGTAREAGRVRRLADGDRRISFLPFVEASNVLNVMAAHDLLVVPSQWMETGPLVVLEAFAAGVPVMGSALGGIAELVQHEVNGLLVEDYQSPQAWTDALRPFCDQPEKLQEMAARITPPPAMAAVAEEMLAVYDGLVGSQRRSMPLVATA